MKKYIALTVVFAAISVFAETKIKPDENTLWLEDGKNIVVVDKPGKGWIGTPEDTEEQKLQILPHPEKGFIFRGKDGKGRKTHRYIPRNPEYRYLVCDIQEMELYNSYRNWTVQIQNGGITWSQAASLNSGIFIFDMFAGRPREKNEHKGKPITSDNFWIYVYGAKIHFNEIKIVKKPEVLIEVQVEGGKKNFTIGDTLKFKVTLKEESEDVSLQLFSSGVPSSKTINGLRKIQLKPTDDTQLVWVADIQVKNFSIPEKEYNRPDRVLVKAVLLGGAVDRPVWTTIPYGFSK